MNDRCPFPHYFDQSGALRVLRGPQPSSTTRLDVWARALLNAYDNRAHGVKIIDKRGTRIRRPKIAFATLLAKIERQLEGEKARGGQQESVVYALKNVFGAQDACGAASMRNHIIDLAYAGAINPDEAETWAHRLGLQQIAKRNGRDLCDPMQEAEWSLVMAAIWIQWRDLRLVARVSPNSEDFLPQWVKIEHEDTSTGYGLDPDDDLEGVKPALARYLRSCRSLATGLRDGERREIASVEWSDLQIVGRYEGEGFATAISPHGERHIYERIRLSRDDLIATFAAPEVEHGSVIAAVPNQTESLYDEGALGETTGLSRNPTLPVIIAAWLLANLPTRTALSFDEIQKRIRGSADDIPLFSPRTLDSAKAIAYSGKPEHADLRKAAHDYAKLRKFK
jgi:hypothetical protein